MRRLIACILIFVVPCCALPYSTTGLVEQQSESAMGRITNRALNYRLRTGDVFEASARLEIQAARLREQKFEAALQQAVMAAPLTVTEAEVTAVKNRLALNNVSMEQWEVRQLLNRDRKAAKAHIQQVGVYRAMMEVAAFARNGASTNTTSFSLIAYSPAARLLRAMTPDQCRGASQAVGVLALIAGIEVFIPGAQGAAGITALFGLMLDLMVRSTC